MLKRLRELIEGADFIGTGGAEEGLYDFNLALELLDELEERIVRLEYADLWVEARRGRDGVKRWVVSNGASVMDRDRHLIYEPMPSSRTDEFIAATRFTLEEAIDMAKKGPVYPE